MKGMINSHNHRMPNTDADLRLWWTGCKVKLTNGDMTNSYQLKVKVKNPISAFLVTFIHSMLCFELYPPFIAFIVLNIQNYCVTGFPSFASKICPCGLHSSNMEY